VDGNLSNADLLTLFPEAGSGISEKVSSVRYANRGSEGWIVRARMLRLVLVWVVAVLCGRGFVFEKEDDADENALWPSHFAVVDVLIGRAPWRSRAEEREEEVMSTFV